MSKRSSHLYAEHVEDLGVPKNHQKLRQIPTIKRKLYQIFMKITESHNNLNKNCQKNTKKIQISKINDQKGNKKTQKSSQKLYFYKSYPAAVVT